eukprot:g14607.t1
MREQFVETNTCARTAGKRLGSQEMFIETNTSERSWYERILAAEEWDHVEYYGSFLDSTVLPTEHRRFCFELYSRLASEGLCLLSGNDELFAQRAVLPARTKKWYQFLVAVIIVNSLPLVEKALGGAEVLAAYRILKALAAEEEDQSKSQALLQWVEPLI